MAQKTDKYSNPLFDNRIYSLSGLKATATGTGTSTSDLQRGYMVQDKNYIKTIQYSVRFLYNPSQLTVTHNTDVTDSSALTPEYYRNPLDTSKSNIPLNAQLQFSLLFDRTYELWNSGATSPNMTYNRVDDPSLTGVWSDVAAMYRTVGILDPTTGTVANPHTSSADPGITSTIASNGQPGPMPMTPLMVYFGGTNSLSYRAYVSGLTVTYTHWSQLMVPMRCTIGVAMNLLTSQTWKNPTTP